MGRQSSALDSARLGRSVLVVGATIAAALAPTAAAAGNLDSYFLSDEAAMFGGAVTAIASDGGSLWTNPAGLASTDRTSFNISASAFQLRMRRFPGILRAQTTEGEVTADLKDTTLLSVPTSLGFAWRLGGVRVGVGVFVPEQDAYEQIARLQAATTGDGAYSYGQEVQLRSEQRSLHAGPGIAWSPAPGWTLGASLLAIYSTVDLQATIGYDVRVPPAPSEPVAQAAGEVALRSAAWSVGVLPVLGVQWAPHPQWRLGLVMRGPTTLMLQKGSDEDSTLIAEIVRGEDSRITRERTKSETDGGFGLAGPPRVHLGVAWLGPGVTVSIDGDLQPPFERDEIDVDTGLVWNVRAGLRHVITPRLALGYGVFTDRSAVAKLTDATQSDVDFYGGSVALRWITRYPLRDRGAGDDIVFQSVVGLRYALGVGEAMGSRVSLVEQDSLPEEFRVDVVFHELTLHIGSSVRF